MNKSELSDKLALKNPAVAPKLVDDCVKQILEHIMQSLVDDDRVELRGFGSFSLHYRRSRVGRNPKTGEDVPLIAKCIPHFKAGKELKERVNP